MIILNFFSSIRFLKGRLLFLACNLPLLCIFLCHQQSWYLNFYSIPSLQLHMIHAIEIVSHKGEVNYMEDTKEEPIDFSLKMEHLANRRHRITESEKRKKDQVAKESIMDYRKISALETGDLIFLRPLLEDFLDENSKSLSALETQISFDEAIYLTGKATIDWWRRNGQPKCGGEVATHVAIAMWESDIPKEDLDFQLKFDFNKYIEEEIILDGEKPHTHQKYVESNSGGLSSSTYLSSMSVLPQNHNHRGGRLMFIQALPENGVSIVDAERFFYISAFSQNMVYYTASVTDEIGKGKQMAAEYAYSQIGKPYAYDFEAPPMSFYCSSLVDWSYFKAFSSYEKTVSKYEGTLYPSNFTLLFVPEDYWENYYKEQGKDLPVNVKGSNPTLLLHSFNISITGSFTLN